MHMHNDVVITLYSTCVIAQVRSVSPFLPTVDSILLHTICPFETGVERQIYRINIGNNSKISLPRILRDNDV